MELIGTIGNENLESFNERLRLHEIVNSEKDTELNFLLKDEKNINFVIYLIAARQLSLQVNCKDDQGMTVFMRIAKYYLKKESYHLGQAIGNLLKRGYEVRNDDLKFMATLYSPNLSSEEFLNWSRLRFAVLTRNGEDFLYALKKQKVLFAILSLKLGRPVFYKLPNLLGVAGNALYHYPQNGDIILRAIKIYARTAEIDRLDSNKGNFAKKIMAFEASKPIQDSRFLVIAGMILPELLAESEV